MLKNEDIKLLYEISLVLIKNPENNELSKRLRDLIDHQNALHLKAKLEMRKANKEKSEKERIIYNLKNRIYKMENKKNLSNENILYMYRLKELINDIKNDTIDPNALQELSSNSKKNISNDNLTEEEKMKKKLHSLTSQISYIVCKKNLTKKNEEKLKELLKQKADLKKMINEQWCRL